MAADDPAAIAVGPAAPGVDNSAAIPGADDPAVIPGADDPAASDQLILVDLADREVGRDNKLDVHRRGLLHRALSVIYQTE